VQVLQEQRQRLLGCHHFQRLGHFPQHSLLGGALHVGLQAQTILGADQTRHLRQPAGATRCRISTSRSPWGSRLSRVSASSTGM